MGFVLRIAILSGVLVAIPASAQTPSAPSPPVARPPAQTAPQPPSAIKLENPELGKKSDEPAGLVPGANSFAEGQARALLDSKGYDNVSALVKDSKGIWHGTATKGQVKVHVSVDYKGNVDAQ